MIFLIVIIIPQKRLGCQVRQFFIAKFRRLFGGRAFLDRELPNPAFFSRSASFSGERMGLDRHIFL
jgi:hypothetical protein